MRQDGVLFAHRTVLNCDVIIENDLCQFGGFLYRRAFGFAAFPRVADGATLLSGESTNGFLDGQFALNASPVDNIGHRYMSEENAPST